MHLLALCKRLRPLKFPFLKLTIHTELHIEALFLLLRIECNDKGTAQHILEILTKASHACG